MNGFAIIIWILLVWLCLILAILLASAIMGLVALIINERKWICCQYYICEKIMGICGYELRDESSDDELSDYESSDYESSDYESSDYESFDDESNIETKSLEIVVIINPDGERKLGIEN